MAPTSDPQRPCRDPLFDIHPLTGASIEVFYADRALETFGKGGVSDHTRRSWNLSGTF
jgi:hypothetical protein